MPDQQEPEQDAARLAEAEAQLPEDHPVLRALRAERAKRKSLSDQLEQTKSEQTKFLELSKEFPFLKPDHFKGRPVEEWTDWATELNELRSQPASAEAGAPETTAQSPAVAQTDESEMVKAQAVSTPRADTPEVKPLTPREAMKQGLSPQEVVQGIRNGTISLVNTSVETNASPFTS